MDKREPPHDLSTNISKFWWQMCSVVQELLPASGQSEPNHDESKSNSHVDQGIKGVHAGHTRAGNVENHEVGQPNDEERDHGWCDPGGGSNPCDLTPTHFLLGCEGVSLTSLGLWHRALPLIICKRYSGWLTIACHTSPRGHAANPRD